MSTLQSTDIYNIADLVNQVQRKFIPYNNEDTLFMGLNGYLNEMFSLSLQNANINASEWGNEAFPIRCKFEKSILTYAIQYNIDEINAQPSTMQVMIGFVKEELEDNMDSNGIFILDRECGYEVEDFEFHLDYDIKIQRHENRGGEVIYTAQYIMDDNPVSDITNPYLQSPIQMIINQSKFLFVTCTIRQVEKETREVKIISNNIFENKTLDFSFDNQLVCFNIVAIDGDKETYLTPIFEGLSTYNKTNYCYYTYIDSSTIRVKFDRDVYEPKANTRIKIIIQTCQGSEGNFRYDGNIMQALSSEKYTYKNLSCLIKPMTDAVYGIDKKDINQLKDIIPKEILSRGNITNNKDLQNFFNMASASKLKLYKRRDNQLERLYYAYLIVKDDSNNIIPTNTIDLSIREDEFDASNGSRLILTQDNRIEYKNSIGRISDYTGDLSLVENNQFIYGCPYVLVINKNTLTSSYYIVDIDSTSQFKFSYINNDNLLQFIATSINSLRSYLNREFANGYLIRSTITQNTNTEQDLVVVNDLGGIVSSKIKPVLVIENENSYKYYKHGKITSYNKTKFSYNVEFSLSTDNIINTDNTIIIQDVYQENTNTLCDIKVPMTCKMYMYIFIEDESKQCVDSIVPEFVNGHTLTNIYETDTDIVLISNFSHIVHSTATISKDPDGVVRYNIKSVPVVRSSYISNVVRYHNFLELLQYRKAFINEALKVLEDSFGIDMKFFNTYGPSKMFNIGYVDNKIDRVNISVKLRLRLKFGVVKNIADLILQSTKQYIENINKDLFEDIHMMNLISYLTASFSDYIEFIEFVGINDYNATIQYIQKIDLQNITDVPEFLNINLLNNTQPDIAIELV